MNILLALLLAIGLVTNLSINTLAQVQLPGTIVQADADDFVPPVGEPDDNRQGAGSPE